jgi:glycine cleavage system H lipoate-binding protein
MVALSVLLGFVLLLICDYVVLRAEKKIHPAFVKNYKIIDSVAFNNLSVTIPADTFVSKGHTWAKPDKNGMVKVGVDEFITKSMGDFVITNTAPNGILLNEGDPVIEARLGGKKVVFRSPVGGQVILQNHDLPGKRIDDPFNEDWGVIIKTQEFQQFSKKLRINEEVIEWMKGELIRFKSYLQERLSDPKLAGVTMFDGGHIVEGVVSRLDNESIEIYEKEFLSI